MRQSVFHRTHIAQVGMHTFSVVEYLYVFEDIPLDFFHCSIVFAVNTLFLCCGKETFGAGIIIGTSRAAHALSDAVLIQHPSITLAAVLSPSVRME